MCQCKVHGLHAWVGVPGAHVCTFIYSCLHVCKPSADVQHPFFYFSQTEKELCLLSRQFEDFVVQFLDRCFALVESSSLEQTNGLDRTVSNSHKSTHETLMGTSVSGAVQGVLTQCSPQIFQVCTV